MELGPNHSLMCHVLNLHSDKEIKTVLPENLSISLNRNTPHKGCYAWRACLSGRFYASLYFSLPKNHCHGRAHILPRAPTPHVSNWLIQFSSTKGQKGVLRTDWDTEMGKLCPATGDCKWDQHINIQSWYHILFLMDLFPTALTLMGEKTDEGRKSLYFFFFYKPDYGWQTWTWVSSFNLWVLSFFLKLKHGIEKSWGPSAIHLTWIYG